MENKAQLISQFFVLIMSMMLFVSACTASQPIDTSTTQSLQDGTSENSLGQEDSTSELDSSRSLDTPPPVPVPEPIAPEPTPEPIAPEPPEVEEDPEPATPEPTCTLHADGTVIKGNAVKEVTCEGNTIVEYYCANNDVQELRTDCTDKYDCQNGECIEVEEIVPVETPEQTQEPEPTPEPEPAPPPEVPEEQPQEEMIKEDPMATEEDKVEETAQGLSDGMHSQAHSYSSPGGTEHFTLNIETQDEIVISASVDFGSPISATAKGFVGVTDYNVKNMMSTSYPMSDGSTLTLNNEYLIIGKNINDFEFPIKISASSLTPPALQEALELIRGN